MRKRALLCSVVVAGILTTVSPAAASSYEIRPGDTLSGIASRHGISTSQLQAANQLTDPHRLIAGRRLVIPTGGGTPTAAAGTHRVRPGETLGAIARRYGTTASALASANGLADPDRLRDGQVLRLGGTTGAPAAPPAAAAAGTHVVRSGDALSTLARRFGTTTSELLRLNGLSDPHRLRVGQVLRLPGAGSGGAPGGGAPATPVTTPRRYPNIPRRLAASPDRLTLLPSFERWAATYGVPVEVLMAVTWLESGWQNHVVSHKGAVGIGQLMPLTSAWLANEIVRLPGLDPTVPDDNIRMTAAFLSWLQRSMGSRERMLAAYYQGPTSVKVLGVFPVTEVYVNAVSSLIGAFRPA